MVQEGLLGEGILEMGGGVIVVICCEAVLTCSTLYSVPGPSFDL